ncbi:MAG: hypothetical protein LBK18_05765 [Prevotellaceae bacterium]|jgi:hypothetical protein|nr:hypothetical protein [Prevotellaceae bacterium]
MGSIKRSAAYFAGALLLLAACTGPPVSRSVSLEEDFGNPPDEAKPWVFWCWANAAVSRESVTADLEAMRQAGIGGACFIPIWEPENPSVVASPVEQLSPEWWEMVRHAMREADRLGLKIAMHDCEGFAPAGGHRITPELSAQKVVWTKKTVAGGQTFCDTLPQPESYRGYYRDIATYAFPAPSLPDSVCTPLNKIINLTKRLKNGRLTWSVPAGRWTILRMGHTSTGHIGDDDGDGGSGAGAGLECDKFNKKAVRLQLDSWFGEVIRQVGTELSGRVLKGLHAGSWEGSSQSWSPVLRREFKRRRGYDMLPYLPVVAGLPVESADFSERFLFDVRQTIAELVADNFYAVMQKSAHKYGCTFSAECVAPAITSDGVARYRNNDVLDAASGAHLCGTGLYFQRDQTWWKPGRAWVEYAQRCQVLLQHGKPVTDIAVFTGEEIPARAVLPERLATTLPGIVGREMVESEVQRLANADEPAREAPAAPGKYVDMLRGYKYDSFSRDALLRLARVANGRIVLPGGASYAMLVLPQSNPLTPGSSPMSAEVATRLLSLIKAGATVLVGEPPKQSTGLAGAAKNDDIVRRIAAQIWGESFAEDADDVLGKIYIKNLGLGRVVKLPYYADSFFQLGLERDAAISENGKYAAQVAWTHRASDSVDIYFISNQKSRQRTLTLALRTAGAPPELWDAVTGSIATDVACEQRGNLTILQVKLPENGSVFVVFRKKAGAKTGAKQLNTFSPSFEPKPLLSLDGAWQVSFDKKQVGENNVAVFSALESWTRSSNPNIRCYSGTACYAQTFTWSVPSELPQQLWLDLGQVASIAEVTLNGQPCGVAWTPPYRVDITSALREGSNTLSIEVTNTWAAVSPKQPDDNLPLQEAGLLGKVKIVGGGE